MTKGPKQISRRSFTAGLVTIAATAKPSFAQPIPDWWTRITPDEVPGPFYPVLKPAENDADLTRLHGRDAQAAGEIVTVEGRILDRHMQPIPNARLELWQANMHGRYAHPNTGNPAPLDPNFQGYADLRADAGGNWRITTVKPGAYADRTRHIHFDVTGRSGRLVTQMYFDDEAALNAADPFLRKQGGRGKLLIAERLAERAYRWDIVLLDP